MNRTTTRVRSVALFSGVAALAAATGILSAQAPRGSVPASPRPAPVRLWARAAPDALGSSEADVPAILPFLPSPASSTGAGLVLVPASGPAPLDADAESTNVATWLNERGIAAFVLRYRSAPRYAPGIAAGDSVRAVRYVRSHAAEFNVAPDRVGLLGVGTGADVVADAAYRLPAPEDAGATDPVARVSGTVPFAGLIYGSPHVQEIAAGAPATFIAASTRQADAQDGSIDLWTKLRAARVPVDAHFVATQGALLAAPGRGFSAWPDAFSNWLRYRGYLTDAPRVALRGMALLDGRPLPHGYVVLTPVGMVGAGPIVARVINSTAGVPIGQFTVPLSQGPVPGRYFVDVHQNANRWLSNAFTSALTRDPAFGHARDLSPSIDDHRVYDRVHPSDKERYTIDIKAGGDQDLRIEVFSGAAPPAAGASSQPDAANPGLAAYAIQQAHTPNPVPGIPQPILLWPQGAPGAIPDANGMFTDEDKPALYAFPVPAASNTGAAFLVLPGGAFTNRATDQEGIQIARWLNRQGMSAFVLRYRIRPTYDTQVSSMDAYRAMRYIRAHAGEYAIGANRVGTIGFSAGAELEGDAFFNRVLPGDPAAADPLDRLSTRSDFNVLVYGGRNLAAPATAPPTFMFVTLEDGGGHLSPQINVLNGLRANGIPVEAHWYQDGPHGTSLSPGDPQLGQWPDLLVSWLKGQGLLGPPPR